MMLDLRNTNALMFRNPNSGQYNMVIAGRWNDRLGGTFVEVTRRKAR
jgi:hypothetical protein